jgi:drug/metabolite transporter (DMT)-like permease
VTQTTDSHSTQTRGYLICLTATAFWSTTAIFIGYLNTNYGLPPVVLAFWRDLMVAVALAGVFAIFWPIRLRVARRHISFLVLYGILLSIFNALWAASVAFNGAAVATVLAYSSPGFTAILGWRLFGESLGRWKVLAVVLSLTGTVLVSGAYNQDAWRLNPLGVITGLSSGLAFAGYSLMGKAASQRGIDPWTTLLYTFGFAALFLLAYNLLPGWIAGKPLGDLFWLGDAWAGWAILFVLAVVPTIGGFGLYTVSLGYLPASVANLIATLEPVMTAALAYIFLGERMTVVQLFGGLVIATGVVLLRISEGRSTSSVQAAGVAD